MFVFFRMLKPRLHVQVLCDNFYLLGAGEQNWTIFSITVIISVKTRQYLIKLFWFHPSLQSILCYHKKLLHEDGAYTSKWKLPNKTWHITITLRRRLFIVVVGVESNLVCNHSSEFLITSTPEWHDWIGRHEVLLLINHNHYNFRKTKKYNLKNSF